MVNLGSNDHKPSTLATEPSYYPDIIKYQKLATSIKSGKDVYIFDGGNLSVCAKTGPSHIVFTLNLMLFIHIGPK